MNIFDKLQTIDRRILYVLIAAVVTIPLIARPAKHPKVIFPEVQSAFDIIDKVPKGKIVIISTIWGPGTEAENEPQTRAIMRHCFQKGIPFMVVSWDQAGTQMTYDDGNEVAAEVTSEGKWGPKKYGTDWVHLGYKMPDTSVMRALMRGMETNFPDAVKKDINNTPVSQLPALSGIQHASKDVGAAIEITPSATIEIWISYFHTPTHVPLIYCPTAVMAAEAFPYLDAGSVGGMLNGVIGAEQYEVLIGQGNVKTDASATTWALSSAHVYILLLILLGNLGYLFSRRAARAQQRGGE